MKTYTLLVWSRSGPRDQTNCMNGWGIRKFVIDAVDLRAAIDRVRGMDKTSGKIISFDPSV